MHYLLRFKMISLPLKQLLNLQRQQQSRNDRRDDQSQDFFAMDSETAQLIKRDSLIQWTGGT